MKVCPINALARGLFVQYDHHATFASSSWPMFYYLFACLLLWIGMTIYLVANSRRISHLRDCDAAMARTPAVDIVVAMRNEENDVEQALSSLTRMRYPGYRIVVVNDRSTDRTPQILERLAQTLPIIVHTVQELPPGWLGKNHALYQGFLASQAEWLLFTDADIVFHPETLSKAMAVVQRQQLDHLTALPHVRSRSALLNRVLSTFAVMLELKVRPWAVRNPKSKAAFGVGAFNLVRRSVYAQAAAVPALRMRPDDDLKLGEFIKAAGFRQDVVNGEGMVQLEWYRNLREFIDGLMKNTFAVSNYNPVLATAGAMAALLIFCLPVPLGLLWPDDACRVLGAAILLCQVLIVALRPGDGKWNGGLMWFAGGLMAWIIVKSMVITLWQGGIWWRGSFYGLKELKGR
ncbi:glycosyltransferase [Hufsiella ginkgonis]|uniref:Glycosyltransferase n=1 Tax=Hufsiella ginkgonis TaxID=2695274 RepID=A0A7K1XUV6_9SPHI|nr:glycosyltransferase family 2 protein [Hufsiella ginkgonis]MXV14793.1 glycosyltransferase [Hufsiella ginkgonis]